MKNFGALLIIIAMFFSAHLTVAAGEAPKERAIVLFGEGDARQILEEMDIEVIENYRNVPGASIWTTKDNFSDLSNMENVVSIEKDETVKSAVQSTGWGIPLIGTPLSWASGYDGKGIKIGVIDSGISPHPDLKIAGGVSKVDYTPSYHDDSGHGTHVAGIIGALDNDIGIIGVAPAADLYAIKVFSKQNTGYLSDVISGIDWAITNKMDILNLSLGAKNGSILFQEVIRKAHAQNILIIAAVGNQGLENPTGNMVEYPARYSETIAVAAVDYGKERAVFSAAGPEVDIAAPGVSIRSTHLNQGYREMSGTSMAAPFVTGQAALIKQAYPGLTNDQVRSFLLKNAIDLGAKGPDPIFGAGLLQAQAYDLPVFGKTAKLNPAQSITLDKTAYRGPERTTVSQTATVKLANGKEVDVTKEAVWKSSNPQVAAVDKGNVSLKSPGYATITVSFGNVSARMDLVVDPSPAEVAANFTDIPESYWAYKEIKKLTELGVITGYPDASFKPESFVKRANAAAMLDRLLDLVPEYEFTAFPDVPESHTYFNEIKAVQQAGIFSGKETGFDPSGELTRAQMAKVLTNAFDLEAEGTNPFPDAQDHWAKEYIDILYVTGITTGSEGNFAPQRNVKRSELAVFIYRALEWQAQQNQP